LGEDEVAGLGEDEVAGLGEDEVAGLGEGTLCAGVVDGDGAKVAEEFEVPVTPIAPKLVSRFAGRSAEHADRAGISKNVSRYMKGFLNDLIGYLLTCKLVVL